MKISVPVNPRNSMTSMNIVRAPHLSTGATVVPIALAVMLLCGCATAPSNPLNLGWYAGVVRTEGVASAANAAAASVAQSGAVALDSASVRLQDGQVSAAPVASPSTLVTATTPAMPMRGQSNTREVEAEKDKPANAVGDNITVNFDQLSLPAFIQTVYGAILKRPLSVDPAVAARTDLVTFRAVKPMNAAELSRFSRQLLKSYGVTVQDFDGLVRFSPDSASTAYSPQVRRGRAQPDVPAQLRPIFHLLELEVVRTAEISGWLRTMFGAKIQVTDDNYRWAVMISGQPDDVAAALEVAQLLDQTNLRGSRSLRLTPANWPAEEFSKRLSDVMTAQGFNTSLRGGEPASLMIMPVQPLNAVFLFSASDDVLQHAVKWAQELDKTVNTPASGGLFSYNVKHTDASSLARLFGDLLGAAAVSGQTNAGGTSGGGIVGNASAQAARPATSLTTPGGVRIVVNPATNSLIIQGGKPEEYRQWTQLLSEFDRPTRSALIEVVVAELTLSNNATFGIEWALQDLLRRNGSVSGGTLGGLEVATQGGLSLLFRDSARQARGLINALATDSNARILSSPKIVAKNGETASIQVGQEVPVITSQQSGGGGSNVAFGGSSVSSGILQSIQYRSTGVILKVKPVIHSNNRLDLEISQEVSGAASTQTGVSSSPTISSRRVETKLSMRDGSTVLLAGLISDSKSGAESGVPLAKDVPILGNLFKSQKQSGNRTELVILITSYIINDDIDAEAITDAFRGSLGSWAKDSLPLARLPGAALRSGQAGLGISSISAPASVAASADTAAALMVSPTVAPLLIRTRVEPGAPLISTGGGLGSAGASPAGAAAGALPARPPAGPAAAGVNGRSTEPRIVTDPDLLKELEAMRIKSLGK